MAQKKSATQAVASGLPIPGLLGVAFVVLKLCGVIGWSWWWVTVPFWGVPAVGIAIVIVAFIGLLVLRLVK